MSTIVAPTSQVEDVSDTCRVRHQHLTSDTSITSILKLKLVSTCQCLCVECFILYVYILIHMIFYGQVFVQPIFGFVESMSKQRWPDSKFVNGEHELNVPLYGIYNVNFFRVIWRTTYVIITAVIAMLLPFFNDFLGLIGSLSFYPLTVYFPIEMYIKKTKMQRFSFTWTWLKILSWVCLVISIISAAGSIQGLAKSLKTYKPFQATQ